MTGNGQSATSAEPMPRDELVALLDRQGLARVAEELAKARAKHPPINSLHEGYSVILEEVEEFWDHVKLRAEKRDQREVCDELIQVAAMAVRTMIDCVLSKEAGRV